MKEIKIIPLAFAFAGCFLGAGFVSGQELWQFFGEFGVKGYIGLLLACVLLAAFGVIMMRLLQKSGIEKAEEIMVPWDVPFLRMAAGLILNIFLLCVVVIMTAGVGATVEQLLAVLVGMADVVMVAAVGETAVSGVSLDGRCGSAGNFRHDEGLLRPGAHHCDCHNVFCRDELGRVWHGRDPDPAGAGPQQSADAQLVRCGADVCGL